MQAYAVARVRLASNAIATDVQAKGRSLSPGTIMANICSSTPMASNRSTARCRCRCVYAVYSCSSSMSLNPHGGTRQAEQEYILFNTRACADFSIAFSVLAYLFRRTTSSSLFYRVELVFVALLLWLRLFLNYKVNVDRQLAEHFLNRIYAQI